MGFCVNKPVPTSKSGGGTVVTSFCCNTDKSVCNSSGSITNCQNGCETVSQYVARCRKIKTAISQTSVCVINENGYNVIIGYSDGSYDADFIECSGGRVCTQIRARTAKCN